MQLTLKNLKISAFMSEETTCFQATVYVDGKKVGTAQNDGHGGPTYYHLDPKYRYLESQKCPIECSCPAGADTDCILCKGTGTWQGTFDELIDHEVYRSEQRKYELKMRKKGFTYMVYCEGGRLISLGGIAEERIREHITLKHPTLTIKRIVAL